MRVLRIEVNQPIPETTFTFQPPLGTRIHDETGSIPPELVEAVHPRIAARALREAEEEEASKPPSVERHLNVTVSGG